MPLLDRSSDRALLGRVLTALKEAGVKTLAVNDRVRLEHFLKAPAPAIAEGDWSAKASLDAVRRAASACTRCGLSEGRTQAVFGSGPDRADLMFVGEAPGFHEDRQGEPFVGRAGQLLTRMIRAMGLKREDVYIANCLKCRPPNNRDPLPDELASCRPFLEAQIERVKPRIICCLGRIAAQALLRRAEPLSRLRGRFHDLGGRRVLCTFHPAYLLRNESDKRLAWEDLKKVRDALKTPHSE